jgi:hypothetical protein
MKLLYDVAAENDVECNVLVPVCDVLVTSKSLTTCRSMSFRNSDVLVKPSFSPPMVLMLSPDMYSWIAFSNVYFLELKSLEVLRPFEVLELTSIFSS